MKLKPSAPRVKIEPRFYEKVPIFTLFATKTHRHLISKVWKPNTPESCFPLIVTSVDHINTDIIEIQRVVKHSFLTNKEMLTRKLARN